MPTRYGSPLATATRISSQSSSRNGTAVDRILHHHSAAFSLNQVVTIMVENLKEVSSNYVIGPNGEIVLVVPESMRAFTSGSSTDGGRGAAWDRRSITYEIINSGGAPDWPISDAAFDAVARLDADISAFYGFPLIRNNKNDSTVLGHRDLDAWYDASYATACPGNYLFDRLPELTAKANEYKTGTTNTPTRRRDMYNGRHPSGAISLCGEFTFDGLTLGEYQMYEKAYGPFVQFSDEEYRQELINVKVRQAQLAAGLGIKVDRDSITATVAAGMDAWFAKNAAKIAEINAVLGKPTS